MDLSGAPLRDEAARLVSACDSVALINVLLITHFLIKWVTRLQVCHVWPPILFRIETGKWLAVVGWTFCQKLHTKLLPALRGTCKQKQKRYPVSSKEQLCRGKDLSKVRGQRSGLAGYRESLRSVSFWKHSNPEVADRNTATILTSHHW